MEFDQNNEIVRLCAEGMMAEGKGEMKEASDLFNEAWDIANTDFEKFTSAHYVARHQPTVKDKLHWDQTALKFALKIDEQAVKEVLPSLYLNIGKCYEDLGDFQKAGTNYSLAEKNTEFLQNDGYGNMIRQGVESGLMRVASKEES